MHGNMRLRRLFLAKSSPAESGCSEPLYVARMKSPRYHWVQNSGHLRRKRPAMSKAFPESRVAPPGRITAITRWRRRCWIHWRGVLDERLQFARKAASRGSLQLR